MAQAQRDGSQITTLLGVSSADDTTPINVRVDPTTRRMLVDVTGGGGTSMTDDAAFTPATTAFTPVGGEFDDTTPDSVDEGDGGAFRMSANRNLYVRIRDNAGNERGLNVDANGAIAVTGGGGGTQFAEDTAHTTGDLGTVALGVRTDTPINRSGIDGDYEPFQLSAGRLWVSATVTAISAGDNNIGNVDIVTLPASTNTIEIVGDAASGAAKAGNPVQIGGVFNTTQPTVTTGQAVEAQATARGAIIIATGADAVNVQATGNIAAAAADSGNPVKIGGKYNSTQPTLTDGQRGDIEISSRGAIKTVLFNNDSAVAIAGTVDNADGVAVSASAIALRTIGRTTIFNGTTWDRLYGTTKGIYTQGDIADDSPTPSNPVLVGGTAKETDGTDPGSVSAEDDVARAITDRNRRLLVNDIHPNLWSANGTSLNAGTAQIKAAPGANLSLYVTDIIFSNGVTAGSMRLISNTTAVTPTNSTAYMSFAVNGGAVVNFRTPIRVVANTDLGIQSSGVSGHGWTINGYIAP